MKVGGREGHMGVGGGEGKGVDSWVVWGRI